MRRTQLCQKQGGRAFQSKKTVCAKALSWEELDYVQEKENLCMWSMMSLKEEVENEVGEPEGTCFAGV